VSVLRRRSGSAGEAVHDLLRLRLVISSSVAGVAGALIPVGMAGYGVDPSLIWRMAALILLVFNNGIIASFVSDYRPVKGTFPPDRLAVLLVSCLELIEQASLIAVLFGLSSGNAPALYVTALIANVCQAGFIFVRFVGSTFSHATELLSDEFDPTKPGD
jgi:hypothetical protein